MCVHIYVCVYTEVYIYTCTKICVKQKQRKKTEVNKNGIQGFRVGTRPVLVE